MLRAAAATPRKKLPPPTTRPICTPVRATSATSEASASTRAASIPNEPSPAMTSPLSLRRMRPYATFSLNCGARFSEERPQEWGRCTHECVRHKKQNSLLFRAGGVADFEPHEPRYRNVLAELRDLGLDHVGDGGRVFL